MTKIFCQNCYDATRSATASVHDVTINGRCTKCGSDAVLTNEVVEDAANAAATQRGTSPSEDRWSLSPQGGRGRRLLDYNHSLIHKSDIVALLAHWDTTLERWWDGHYFQLNYNFLYYRLGPHPVGYSPHIQRSYCYSPTLDILLENSDGSQRYITFEVTLAKLEPVDAKAFNVSEAEIEP